MKNINSALGNGEKIIQKSEEKNLNIARKSIVAACKIKKGDLFSVKNLTAKRPGDGISPMRWNEIMGMEARRDFEEDELIEL